MLRPVDLNAALYRRRAEDKRAVDKVVQSGWDVGTMEFSGTIPLLGIQPNQGNARQYEYHILKITEDELRLCAPEPGAGAWGTAWFWNFMKK